MNAAEKARARADARAAYTQRMLTGMRIARGHLAGGSRTEHASRCREMRRFARRLQAWHVTTADMQDAAEVLAHLPDAPQPDMFGPAPRVGKDPHDEHAHDIDASAAQHAKSTETGAGPYGSGAHAGSTAAIPGQLVEHEVTEQGTDTYGE